MRRENIRKAKMSWNPKERPVFSPEFWANRLRDAERSGDPNDLHKAVFNTDIDTWRDAEERHRALLAKLVGPHDSILDIGCGYGRMLDLLPEGWDGHYLGVDVAPAFIARARRDHPKFRFRTGDLRDLTVLRGEAFDWGIGISVKRVFAGHAGAEAWAAVEANLRRHCARLLFLDYDAADDEEPT